MNTVFVWSEHWPDYDLRMELMSQHCRVMAERWPLLHLQPKDEVIYCYD